MNDGDCGLKTPFSLKYYSFIRQKRKHKGEKKKQPKQFCIVFTSQDLLAHKTETVSAKIASYIIAQHQADNGKASSDQGVIIAPCSEHWRAHNWLQLDFLQLDWSFQPEIKDVITLMRCWPEGKFLKGASPSSLALKFSVCNRIVSFLQLWVLKGRKKRLFVFLTCYWQTSNYLEIILDLMEICGQSSYQIAEMRSRTEGSVMRSFGLVSFRSPPAHPTWFWSTHTVPGCLCVCWSHGMSLSTAFLSLGVLKQGHFPLVQHQPGRICRDKSQHKYW